jgi:peptidoglycan/LPS O-acetylase OafA/YrhL
MVGEDDATGSPGAADAAPSPPFASMIARHRGGMDFNRRLALGLGLGGLGLLLLAFAGSPALRLPVLVMGALALALAVLPLRAVQERRERIEGLEVLAEEWRTAGPAERDRLTGLLARLYR